MSSKDKRKEEFAKLPKRQMVTPTKGAYKGHVSVKSSVYAATGCTRLSSQNMVRDHLDAHYQRVNSAKSCIDNGKPKSWTNSTLKKDQVKRNKIKQKQNSRPSSSASTVGRNSRMDQEDDDFEFKDLDFDETATGQGLLASSQNGRHSSIDRVPSRTMTASQRAGLTPRSTTSKNFSGDVLDTMSTSFVAPARPYTPRTKKSTAESWLSKSNVYNSPKKSTRPQKKSRKNLENINNEEELNNSLNYRNGLNDTFDKEETTRAIEGHRSTSGWVSDEDFENNVDYDNQKPLYSSAIRNQKMNTERAIHSSLKIQQEEEELLYLEFVTDVTTDVLNRGVYTNRMLKQIFESHITNNKDRLDGSRMQNLVQQLQQDLAIEDDDALVDGENAGEVTNEKE